MSERVELIHPKKKRLRNQSEWQREKRKRLRIAGKEYVNSKGDLVGAKTMGDDCKCRRKCFLNVPEEIRGQLFHGYYSLKNHDEQNAYLFSLIRRQNIARKRSKNSDRRSCTYKYFLRLKSGELQVCRLAFANIHGISPHKIRILCQKLEKNVMFPSDERGKHDNRPTKIPSVVLNSIKEHIHSVINSDKVRDFLKEIRNTGAELNITKMWKDYIKNYDPCFKGYIPSCGNGWEDGLNCNEISGILSQKSKYAVMNKKEKQQDTTCTKIGVADEILFTQNSSVGNSQLFASDEGKAESCVNDISNPVPMVKHWLYNRVFHEAFSLHDYSLLKKRLHEKLNTSRQSSVQQKSVRKQRLPKKIPQDKEEKTSKEPSKPIQEASLTHCSEQSHLPPLDDVFHLPPSDLSGSSSTTSNVHGAFNAAETGTHMLTNFIPLPEYHGTLYNQKLLQDPGHIPLNPQFSPGGVINANYQTSQFPLSLMLANINQQGTNIPSQYFDAGANFYE